MSQTSNASQTQTNEQLPPWLRPNRPMTKRVRLDLEQDDRDEYAVLKCPACGFNYNHLTAVEVRGGIGYSLKGVGTRIDCTGTKIFHASVGRGVAIDLVFSCENGHDYTYTLEFYKGQMEVRQREMPGTMQCALWRD